MEPLDPLYKAGAGRKGRIVGTPWKTWPRRQAFQGMIVNSNRSIPSAQQFLDADPSNFRYEPSGTPNELRLFHCTPEGDVRFALYFGPYQQTDNGPFRLRVVISNIAEAPSEVTVHAEFRGRTVLHLPKDGLSSQELAIASKVCQVLDRHAGSRSAGPIALTILDGPVED